VKASCLKFLVISCAALMFGTAYADSSSPASQQKPPKSSANRLSNRPKDGKPSVERRDDSHLSGKNHTRSPAVTIKDRPEQRPNNRKHSPSGNTMSIHRLGSDNSGSAVKAGLIQHETINTAVPRRSSGVIRHSVPSVNNVRHRGANPATIGGPAKSNSRNAGAINGTSVHRRP
jgi:hypothetical protein